jgi:Rod binding domain-containing protein
MGLYRGISLPVVYETCRMLGKIECNLRTYAVEAIQPLPPFQPPPSNEQALRKAAEELEASFLAEMLKSAGLGQTSDSFGGGAGEDQFSSFLVREQALAMVRAGGIGLSESIFESLKEKENVSKNT